MSGETSTAGIRRARVLAAKVDGENGATRRAITLANSLEQIGFETELIWLDPTDNSTAFSRYAASIRDCSRDSHAAETHLVLACGVQLAHAAQAFKVPIRLVDVCDSLNEFHLRRLARRDLRAILGWVNAVRLFKLARSASAVTYISETDRRRDRLLLSRLRTGVISNAVDPSLFDVPVLQGSARGVCGVFGDFSYAPNREALSWLISKVWPHFADSALTLNVYGKHVDRIKEQIGPTFKNVLFRGYVRNLAAAYEECSFTLAPSFSGGVKNKVLESLAACRPVLTTKLGSRGIDPNSPGLFRLSDPMDFCAAIAMLEQGASAVEMSRRMAGCRRRFGNEASARQMRELIDALSA